MASGVLEKSTRLADLRKLGVAALAFFLVGCGVAWALRWPLAIWVIDHSGVLRVAEATSPSHVAYATIVLALCTGGMFAVHPLTWLVGALLAPAAFAGARRRLAAYLGASALFALSPLLLLRWHEERVQAALSIDPSFSPPSPCEQVILYMAHCAMFLAAGAALVVPVFVLARYHSARPGPGRFRVVAWLFGGIGLLFADRALSLVDWGLGRWVLVMIVISAVAGFNSRRLHNDINGLRIARTIRETVGCG